MIREDRFRDPGWQCAIPHRQLHRRVLYGLLGEIPDRSRNAGTRTLAVELGPYGIRANAVLPGFIDTPIHGDLLEDKRFLRNYLKLIPLNRIGRPKDMANIVFFLSSDQSAFVTGQGIVADGGQMSGQSYARVFGNLASFKTRQRRT